MNDLMFKIRMSCIFVTEMIVLYGLRRHIKNMNIMVGLCYQTIYNI